MDLFKKCYDYTEVDEVKKTGFYPYFRVISSEQSTEVIVNGKKMLMLGSNSYLGLTNHPDVISAAIKATEKYGTGCGGSRFLNGTIDLHVELEKKLAKFVNKEAALVFSTGFQTNLGTISAIAGRNDIIFMDKVDHASIVDGTRLSFAKVIKFKHNDLDDLERLLINAGNDKGKLVVIDGVFSMDGDIAPLPDYVELCKKHDCRIMVDDAHSFGVLGKQGRGTANHFGLDKEIDLIMGTFSKSFASIGGFIAGDEKVINYIQHKARALIFSASLIPAAVAAVDASLEIMQNQPELIDKLWENTRFMKKGLDDAGFNTGVSETPIIPIIIGDNMLTFKFWKMLSEFGIFVNPVVPPAVQPDQSLIRTSYMATHTREQLQFALDMFIKAGKELGIIK